MTKFRTLFGVLTLIPLLAIAQYVEVSASGGGPYSCRVDGVEVSTHSSEYKASAQAANLKLENPDSTVICEQNRSLVATLTAAGKKLLSDAHADVLLGGVDEYPGPTSLIIDEDFSTTPLANDEDPYYDDGTAFDKCTPSGLTGDWLCYEWTEGDTGTNGLESLRALFLDAAGNDSPQSEVEIEFDFASSANFDDVNSTTQGIHVFYIRTNLDGLYGNNTTFYLEPDGNGRWWMDLNKSDQPATWQEVRQTVNVDTYDGDVHHIKLYIKKNSDTDTSDGIIKLWVDDTLTIDRSDIKLFIYDNQYFDNLSFGPYILGGVNDATGVASIHIDKLKVRGLADASVGVTPGVFQFQQSSYSVSEGTTSLVVTVTRTVGTDGAADVTVTSTDDTATAGSDYTAVNSTLSFADGDVSKTVTVTIADDETVEGAEAFTLSLSNATGGATVGGVGDATVTINDDEPAEVGSLIVDYPISTDGHDELIFTVRIPATVGADVPFTYTTFDIATGDEYGEAGTDYTATSGSSSIVAGQLYKQITVPIAGNNPTGGRNLVGFRVTDSDSAVTTVQGLILRSIVGIDFSRPNSVSPSSNRTIRWMGTDQSSYSNGWIGNYAGGATVNVDNTAPTGYKSMLMPLNGGQGDRGIGDTSFTPIIGSVNDGQVYYHKWWMKLEDDFRWDADSGQGAGNQVAKAGRMTRPGDLIPGYTTVFMRSQGFYWSPSYPEQSDSDKLFLNFDNDPYHGNVRGSDLVADLGADVTEWREYIFVEKRNTGRATDDGYVKLYIDCQLADQILDTNVTTDYPSPGDGESRVRLNWGGFLGRTHPQMVGQGVTPPADSGGNMWVADVYTSKYWPSAKCPVPSP